MSLYLFNSLTRKKEKFISIEPNKVKIYTCGPTVYNFAHIGNLRTYIFEDLLCRTLRESNFKVKHVMNITDVGHLEYSSNQYNDKVNLSAKSKNKTPWEIAKKYEIAFFMDFKKLLLLKPTIICRATDHIVEIQKHISLLIEKKFAYEVNGNVYFKISKFKNYNKLFRKEKENKEKISRIKHDKQKGDLNDFVLWFSNSKFPNQIMKWKSPWGDGFPGWHIECSAMAIKHLGEYIDIHAGGIDHIYTHNTNEIAQSEGLLNHKWVNYWIHGEFLLLNDKKMSKSEKNSITLTDLIKKNFSPLHYKYLCFTSHYRSRLLFNFESLSAAKNGFESLKNRIINLKTNPDNKIDKKKEILYSDKFFESIFDDLNSPLAISIIWKMIKDKSLGSSQKLKLIIKFDKILGLDIQSFSQPNIPINIKKLIEEREKARRDGNWMLSDKIRNKLIKKGILIKDSKNATNWYYDY